MKSLISQYENTIFLLNERLNKLKSFPLLNYRRIRLLIEEIEDLEFALNEMRRIDNPDYVGMRTHCASPGYARHV